MAKWNVTDSPPVTPLPKSLTMQEINCIHDDAYDMYCNGVDVDEIVDEVIHQVLGFINNG